MGGFLSAPLAALTVGAIGFQGGFGGGGGGGGQQGGGQGGQGQVFDRNVQNIENTIAAYLDGQEIKSILTPGEFTEWPLDLKAGQVVFAQASSEAFDPALQIVEGEATVKVLAENDDRYPGDQRPLLMWRCPKDGAYKLRGRCFRDKAGGQMFLTMKTYDSVDLTAGQTAETKRKDGDPLLFRMSMKAGQIYLAGVDNPDPGRYASAQFRIAISPVGLPDIRLGQPLASMSECLVMAPVDGDYYVLTQPMGRPGIPLRVNLRELKAKPLARESGISKDVGRTGGPALWSLSVKAGEVLQVGTPGLALHSGLVVAEIPDISKYDLAKPGANPFHPKTKSDDPEKGPAITMLPARARDPRLAVFVARRDAQLWVASGAIGKANTDFELGVQPAARNFVPSVPLTGRLKIGNTDYWQFDAKVGDVMRFQSTTGGFAQRVQLRGPELEVVWASPNVVDEDTANWEFIVDRPGRYLVSVSCLGDGGAGEYTLNREIFTPQEIKKGAPAQGELEKGKVHVWKLAARPEEPLLVRWKSDLWNYSISIRDESGAPTGWSMTRVDPKNQYGILKVDKPRTLMIVLIPGDQKTPYSIELSDLPGLKGN